MFQQDAEGGWLTLGTGLCRGVLQDEAGREGRLRSVGQKGRPACQVRLGGSRAQGLRGGAATSLGEETEEGRGLVAPSPADFQGQDNQAAAIALHELWVRAFFGSSSGLEGRGGGGGTARRAGSAGAGQRGDQCCVHGQLRAIV